MKGSVKIMLSYDYCHFEIALENDNLTELKDVNNLRKDAQKLADEAVRQYRKSKEQNKILIQEKREEFLKKIEKIQLKPVKERTIEDKAMLKTYDDDDWDKHFTFYDYNDDDNLPF